jgi:hypothetical protein
MAAGARRERIPAGFLFGVRHGLGADQEVQVLAAGGVYWVLAQAMGQ